jgi:hypothetical protein
MELFDPKKAPSSGRQHDPTARRRGLAVLKDGRLLITGGRIEGGQMTALAEICNLGTRTCKPVPSLLEARADHTAIVLADGSVLLVGGSTAGDQGIAWASSSVRLFLPWALNPTPSPKS